MTLLASQREGSPRTDFATDSDGLFAFAVVADGDFEFQRVLVHQRLHKHVRDAHRRQAEQEYILPDAHEPVGHGAARIRRTHLRVTLALLVEQRVRPDADEQLVVAVTPHEPGDVQIEGQVLVEVRAGRLSVDDHLAIARHRLEMQHDAPLAPVRGHAKRSAQPAHLDVVPRGGVAGEIDRVRPERPLRARANVASAAPGVHVPRGGNLDGCLVPAVAAWRRQLRCFASSAFEVRWHHHGLELPSAVKANFRTERFLRGFHPAFRRRKVAPTLHARSFCMGQGRACQNTRQP